MECLINAKWIIKHYERNRRSSECLLVSWIIVIDHSYSKRFICTMQRNIFRYDNKTHHAIYYCHDVGVLPKSDAFALGKFLVDSEKAEAQVRMKTGEAVQISKTKKRFFESDLYKASLPGQSATKLVMQPKYAETWELMWAQERRKKKQEPERAQAFRF